MQTLSEIRAILEAAGLRPTKRFGQNFLIDKNLMSRVVDLAEVDATQTVLEVGPGTGSLTEELLRRAGRVVAVEIDRGLADVLESRLGGRENFQLVRGDALESKHALSPALREAVGERASLVANLPYNVATPLIALLLEESWRSQAARSGPPRPCRFDRLTFTVQKEVAERFAAGPGSTAYGAISIQVALLGRLRLGPVIPASAFWPRPEIASQIVRIDFDEQRATAVPDLNVLASVVNLAFAQRRKQIGSIVRRKDSPFSPAALAMGLEAAGIAPELRPEQVPPQQFAALTAALKQQSTDYTER